MFKASLALPKRLQQFVYAILLYESERNSRIMAPSGGQRLEVTQEVSSFAYN